MIFDNLYKYFFKKKTQIIFTINNSKYDVDILLKDSSDKSIAELSTLILFINKGLLMSDILLKLNTLHLSHNHKQFIVNNMIQNSNTILDNTHEKNELLVKPSMAFVHNVKQK